MRNQTVAGVYRGSFSPSSTISARIRRRWRRSEARHGIGACGRSDIPAHHVTKSASRPNSLASGEKERDLRSATVALQPRGYGGVVQRLSARGAGGDNHAGNAGMVAAQAGEASNDHRLLSELVAWLGGALAVRLAQPVIDDAGRDT